MVLFGPGDLQRVYELARDMGLDSKEVLARAQELGIEVKTASSGLAEDDDRDDDRDHLCG